MWDINDFFLNTFKSYPLIGEQILNGERTEAL